MAVLHCILIVLTRHSAPSDKETQPTYNAFAQSLKRAQHATHRPTEARNKDYTPQIPFQKSFSPERKTESIGRHKMAVETHTLSSSSTRTSENSHSPAQTQVTAPTQAPELPLLPLDYRPQESAHKMLPRTIRLDRTSSTRGRPSQSAATTQRERKISDNAITATRNRSRLNPKDKRYSMDVSLYASQYDKGTRLPPSSDALCENNLRPLRQAHTLAMSQQERRQRHGTGESGSVISTFALTEMLANHETCMLENEETPLDWDDTMTLRSYSRSDGPAQRPLSAHYPSLNSKSSVYSPKSIQRMVPDSIATRNRTLSTPEKYKLSLNTLASKQQILPRPRTVSLPQKERPKEETRATQTDSIEPLDTFQQAVERLRKDSNASRHGNTAYTNREMVSHSEPTSRMKEVLPTTPRLSDNHTTRSIMTARQTRNIEFKTQEAQTTAVDMDSSTWTLSSASQSGGSSIFEPSSPEGQPTSGDSSLSNSPSDAIVAVDTKTQAKAHSMDEHNKATERMKKETILSSLRHRPTRTDHRRQSASVPTAYTPVEKKRHSMVVDMREKEKSPIVGSRVTFGMDSPREMRAVKQRMVGSRTFHSDIKRDGQSFRETIRTYPTPVKSVTESAKEVLADIRQRRQGLSSQTKIHGETVLESKKSPKPNVLPQLSLRRKTVVGYETKQHSVTDTTHRTNSRESTPHLQKSKVKIQRTPTESISISGPGDYRYRTEPLDAVQRTRAVDRLSSRRHSSFIESKSSVEEGKHIHTWIYTIVH
ncbi:hypothetical protein BDF14DRAFT_1089903 [Spinellus fusiger]|nr:hypothetical protein BDF14DRAFT_1089903 [Spinellus fusiger]